MFPMASCGLADQPCSNSMVLNILYRAHSIKVFRVPVNEDGYANGRRLIYNNLVRQAGKFHPPGCRNSPIIQIVFIQILEVPCLTPF